MRTLLVALIALWPAAVAAQTPREVFEASRPAPRYGPASAADCTTQVPTPEGFDHAGYVGQARPRFGVTTPTIVLMSGSQISYYGRCLGCGHDYSGGMIVWEHGPNGWYPTRPDGRRK